MALPRCPSLSPKEAPCIQRWEDSLDILERERQCHPSPSGESCASPVTQSSTFVQAKSTPPKVEFTPYVDHLRDPQVVQDLSHYTTLQETVDLLAADWIPKLQTAFSQGDVAPLQEFMEAMVAALGVEKMAKELEALTPPPYSEHTLDYTQFLKNTHYKTRATQIIARNFSKDCNQPTHETAIDRMEWELQNLREAHKKDLGGLEIAHQNALTRFERVVLSAIREASDTGESEVAFQPGVHELLATFLGNKGESFAAYSQFHKAEYKMAALAKKDDRLWPEVLSYRVRALAELPTTDLPMYNKTVQDAYAVARFHQKFLRQWNLEQEKVRDFSLRAARFTETLENAMAAKEGAIGFADFVEENEEAIQAYEILMQYGGPIRLTLRRLAAAQDETTIQESSRELEAKLALLDTQVKGIIAAPKGRAGYIRGFVGEMYASILGDPSRVQMNYLKAWQNAYRTRQAENAEEKLEDLSKEFRAYVKERVKESNGALPLGETVAIVQNMGIILVDETDHNGLIEKEFDKGREKKAKARLEELSEDVDQVLQFFEPHRGDERDEEIQEWETKLRARVAFDGKLAIHRADLAKKGLDALAEEYPNSEFLKAKKRAVEEDIKQGGWLATARERSVYLANSFQGWRRASRGALLTAAGGFGGSAAGCGAGMLIGWGVAGPPGAAGGCKIGAWFGGAAGTAYGAYKNIALNVEEHRAEIEAAAKLKISRVNQDEYESYLTQYQVEMACATAAGLIPLPMPTRAGLRFFAPTIDTGRRFALWVAGNASELPGRYLAAGGWRGVGAALGETITQGAHFVYQHPFRSLLRTFQATGMMAARLLFGSVPGFNNVPAGILNGNRLHHLLVFLGQLEYDGAVQALKGVGWKQGLKNMATVAWRSAESASLPYFAGELAYRFRNDPPENIEEIKLSFWGGISMLFSLVRLSPYLGVNKAGMNTVFLIDRVGDAALQWTSGQPLDEVDMYRLGMTFFTQTLIGNARGNWARDWILRQNPNLVRKAGILVGDARKPMAEILWRNLNAEEQGVLGNVLRRSNFENNVVLGADGSVYGANALNFRRINPRQLTDRNVVATLSDADRATFARLVSGGKQSWDDLFEAGATAQKFQIKADPNKVGGAYFVAVHDTLVGTLWDGVRGEYIMGADGLNMGLWTLDRSLTILYPRQLLKLRLGWDTPRAILVDRFLGKYSTDWVATKYRPHFAKQAFGRKDYAQNALNGDLDDFIGYHASDNLRGGFGSWHWHYPFALNDASPFEPEDGAYEKLPEHYTSEKAFTPREREELEDAVDQVIAEAKGRLQGWSSGEKKEENKNSKYDDATVVETALAISASAFVAYQEDPKFFGAVVKKHRDWFDVLESSGIHTPPDVNDFVDTLTEEDDVWRQMNPLTQFHLEDPWYEEIPAFE